MLKHRGGVLTPYGAATPLCPSGYGGVGRSPALACLEDATASIFGTPPWVPPYGARNATHGGFRPDLQKSRVVERAAQDAVTPRCRDIDQLGVPARHQQGDERERRWLRLQHRGQQMGLHVVDPEHRDVQRPGQPASPTAVAGRPRQGTRRPRGDYELHGLPHPRRRGCRSGKVSLVP